MNKLFAGIVLVYRKGRMSVSPLYITMASFLFPAFLVSTLLIHLCTRGGRRIGTRVYELFRPNSNRHSNVIKISAKTRKREREFAPDRRSSSVFAVRCRGEHTWSLFMMPPGLATAASAVLDLNHAHVYDAIQ